MGFSGGGGGEQTDIAWCQKNGRKETSRSKKPRFCAASDDGDEDATRGERERKRILLD